MEVTPVKTRGPRRKKRVQTECQETPEHPVPIDQRAAAAAVFKTPDKPRAPPPQTSTASSAPEGGKVGRGASLPLPPGSCNIAERRALKGRGAGGGGNAGCGGEGGGNVGSGGGRGGNSAGRGAGGGGNAGCGGEGGGNVGSGGGGGGNSAGRGGKGGGNAGRGGKGGGNAGCGGEGGGSVGSGGGGNSAGRGGKGGGNAGSGGGGVGNNAGRGGKSGGNIGRGGDGGGNTGRGVGSGGNNDGRGVGGGGRNLNVGFKAEAVDTVLRGVIENTIARDEAVTITGLVRETNRILNHKLDVIQLSRTSALFQGLQRRLGDIEMFVNAFVVNRTVSTLFDLSNSLCHEFDVDVFAELNIGPLLAQPTIQSLFSPQLELTTVPEITAIDVMFFLKDYMSKNPWGAKVVVADFMSGLAKRKNLRGVGDLCIKTNKYFPGPFLRMFGVVGKLEKKTKDEFEQKLTSALKLEIKELALKTADPKSLPLDNVVNFLIRYKAKTKFRSFNEIAREMERVSGLKQKTLLHCATALLYLTEESMSPFLTKLVADSPQSISKDDLMSLLEQAVRDTPSSLTGGNVDDDDDDDEQGEDVPSKPEGLRLLCRVEQRLRKGLGNIQVADLGHGSFNELLASIDPSLIRSFFNADREGTARGDDADLCADSNGLLSATMSTKELSASVISVGEAMLLAETAQALISGAPTLAGGADVVGLLVSLGSIEVKLCQLFEVNDFSKLGHGPNLATFLSKKVSRAVIRRALTPRGGVTREEVLTFVAVFLERCNDRDTVTLALCAKALTALYGVPHESQLGFGDLSDLIRAADARLAKTVPILPLRALTGPSVESDPPTITLDVRDPSVALKCLAEAPFLFDCASWLQWSTVFEPFHGPLRDFVQRECNNISSGQTLAFVEDGPPPNGALLKYDAKGSKEKLITAAANGDSAETALQLVSLCAHGLPRDDFMMLETLAMRPALQRIYGSARKEPLNTVCLFVLATLRSVPTTLRVFLSPLVVDPVFHCSEESPSCVQKFLLDSCADNADRCMLHQISARGDSCVSLSVICSDFQACLSKRPINDSRGGLLSQQHFQRATLAQMEKPVCAATTAGEDSLSATATVNELSHSKEDDNVQTKDDYEPVKSFGDEYCRGVITDIRLNTFEVQEDGTSLGGKTGMRLMLDRALEKISADLYSEDTHFVMELIQNAADNRYAEGIEPRLQFELTQDSILVFNNEIGFSEANVRGLCNVGGSTKGKGGAGYIGQKGIGWKSVFSVSDRPMIYSNGFNFSLDTKSKVIPELIEACDLHPAAIQYSNETCFVLPLNNKMMERSVYLSDKFGDISPLLLLFLNRLRRLIVKDGTDVLGEASTRDMCRVDKQDGIVELHTNGEVEHFFIVRRLVDVPKEIARNENTLRTEVSIAFALGGEDSLASSQDFPVFAFLPVQPYGLKFIFQGDFILSSGRESIRADSPWNQWLRNELPQLFLDAIEKAKESESPLDIQLVLDVAPLPIETFSFFKAVAKETLRRLLGHDCLPTEGGGWSIPAQVVMGSQNTDFISSEVLQATLGKKFMSRDVTLRPELCKAFGIESLGMDDLVVLLEGVCGSGSSPVGTSFIAQWLFLFYQAWRGGRGGLEGVGSQTLPDWLLKKLGTLAFLPLQNGTMSSLADGHVFFSTSEDSLNVECRSALLGFQNEIRSLDPNLERDCSESPSMKAAAHRILEIIGVRQITMRFVVEEHISRRLKAHALECPPFPVCEEPSSWNEDLEAEKKRMLAYARFVKGYCYPRSSKGFSSTAKTILATLGSQGGLPLPVCVIREKKEREEKGVNDPSKVYRTKRFVYSLRPKHELCMSSQDGQGRHPVIHLPPPLASSPKHIETFFSTCPSLLRQLNWTVVDMDALTGSSDWSRDRATVDTWREVLRILGVADFIRIQEREVPFPELDDASGRWRNAWAGQSKEWWESLRSGKRKVVDYFSGELEQLLKAVVEHPEGAGEKNPAESYSEHVLMACQAFFSILASNWATSFQAISKITFSASNKQFTGSGYGNHDGNDDLATTLRRLEQESRLGGVAHKPASSFVLFLMQHHWVPAVPPPRQQQLKQKNLLLYRPEEVFLNSESIAQYFRHHAIMLDRTVETTPEFLAAVGIRSQVDVPCVLQQLERWSQASFAGSSPPFITCVQMMETIYRLLSGEVESRGVHAKKVCALFLKEPLVWIPSRRVEQDDSFGYSSGKEAVVEGTFHRLEKLCFNDPSFVLEAIAGLTPPQTEELSTGCHFRVLAAHYNSLSSFFSRLLCLPCRRDHETIKFGNRGKRNCSDCRDDGLSQGEPIAAVCAFPAFEDYAFAIETIACHKSVEQGRPLAMDVFKMWGNTLFDQQKNGSSDYGVFAHESNRWPGLLAGRKIFPTSMGWQSLGSNSIFDSDHSKSTEGRRARKRKEEVGNGAGILVLGDSATLVALFGKETGLVCLLDLPPLTHSESVGELFNYLKIPLLSSLVREEVVDSSVSSTSPAAAALPSASPAFAFGTPIRRLLEVAVAVAQRWLLSRRPDWHAALTAARVGARLGKLGMVPCSDNLEVAYHLHHPSSSSTLHALPPTTGAAAGAAEDSKRDAKAVGPVAACTKKLSRDFFYSTASHELHVQMVPDTATQQSSSSIKEYFREFLTVLECAVAPPREVAIKAVDDDADDHDDYGSTVATSPWVSSAGCKIVEGEDIESLNIDKTGSSTVTEASGLAHPDEGDPYLASASPLPSPLPPRAQQPAPPPPPPPPVPLLAEEVRELDDLVCFHCMLCHVQLDGGDHLGASDEDDDGELGNIAATVARELSIRGLPLLSQGEELWSVEAGEVAMAEVGRRRQAAATAAAAAAAAKQIMTEEDAVASMLLEQGGQEDKETAGKEGEGGAPDGKDGVSKMTLNYSGKMASLADASSSKGSNKNKLSTAFPAAATVTESWPPVSPSTGGGGGACVQPPSGTKDEDAEPLPPPPAPLEEERSSGAWPLFSPQVVSTFPEGCGCGGGGGGGEGCGCGGGGGGEGCGCGSGGGGGGEGCGGGSGGSGGGEGCGSGGSGSGGGGGGGERVSSGSGDGEGSILGGELGAGNGFQKAPGSGGGGGWFGGRGGSSKTIAEFVRHLEEEEEEGGQHHRSDHSRSRRETSSRGIGGGSNGDADHYGGTSLGASAAYSPLATASTAAFIRGLSSAPFVEQPSAGMCGKEASKEQAQECLVVAEATLEDGDAMLDTMQADVLDGVFEYGRRLADDGKKSDDDDDLDGPSFSSDRAAAVLGEAIVFHALRKGILQIDGMRIRPPPPTLATGEERIDADGADEDCWQVEWVNGGGESFLPFDVAMTKPTAAAAAVASAADGGTGGEQSSLDEKAPRQRIFIEVKTTTRPDKRAFEVSLPELECARQHGDAYMIARVFLGVDGGGGHKSAGEGEAGEGGGGVSLVADKEGKMTAAVATASVDADEHTPLSSAATGADDAKSAIEKGLGYKGHRIVIIKNPCALIERQGLDLLLRF